MTMPVLRRQIDRELARELWHQAGSTQARGVTCPACLQTAAAVHVAAGEERLELDVCLRCTCVWFDAGERERVPEPVGPPLVTGC